MHDRRLGDHVVVHEHRHALGYGGHTRVDRGCVADVAVEVQASATRCGGHGGDLGVRFDVHDDDVQGLFGQRGQRPRQLDRPVEGHDDRGDACTHRDASTEVFLARTCRRRRMSQFGDNRKAIFSSC